MTYAKYLKQILLVFLFINLGNLIFAFPSFEFSQTSYESGEVDVSFESSRGVRVSFYANENFVDSIDVIGNPIEIQLDSEISDLRIPINSRVIFRNVHPTDVFKINISGMMYKTLNPGQSSNQVFFDTADVFEYRNEQTNTRRNLIVEDETIVEKFMNINQNYLVDGENKFRFQIASLYNNFETYNEEFSVNYNKFPNAITVNEFENVTKEKRIQLTGSVTDSKYPLYYVVNIVGPLANLGALRPIELINGNQFNFTVTGLSEGVNKVRLISTNPDNQNIFTGEKILDVVVDNEKPVIQITNVFFKSNTDNTKKVFLEGDNVDTNSNSIVLNISVDGDFLNYTFNNKSETAPINDNSIELELNLKVGKNNLELIVSDLAGNIGKKASQINYDNEKPDIVEDSLEPSSVFEEKSVHFFLQNIEGKTNKPNVNMVIFTLPEGATDRDGNSVSCDSYSNVFFRQLDDSSQNEVDPVPEIPDGQLSLLSLIAQKEEIKSDGNGNFETLITLQEKDYEVSDFESNKISSVKSDNRICMVLSDKFGNTKTKEYRVTYDAGNTMWDDIEILVSPQTVYEAELLQGDNAQRTGSGNVEVGIIAQFQYLGGSQVKEIPRGGVRIQKDIKTYPDTKYVDIISDRINYAYEKESNIMTVYIPVAIKKIENQEDKEEREWFDEIELGFAMAITYSLEEIDVPIDTQNPVYFQTKVVVENTMDWLSYEQIEKWQGFLNKTIKVTETFTEYMKWGTLGGVIACTGAKFYHGYEMVRINAMDDGPDKQQELEDNDRNLYMICDRIAGLAAPYECDTTTPGTYTSPDSYNLGVEYQRDGKTVGQFNPQVGGSCKTPTGQDGKLVAGKGVRYKEDGGYGFTRSVEEEVVFEKQCLPADENGGIDFGAMRGNICYSPEAPKFDDTKCNFFGMDENGVSGKDPATSIISSIRCGAITDTYSHSKNLLKIQQGIYDCLEQAKVGTVKGSYCQRLFGQAVCDIATNVVLPELEQSFNPSSPVEGGGQDRGGGVFDFFGQMKKNEKKLSDRYQGTILSQTGLSSDQIINKACLGAITGDWSALTENVLGAIDANEVEPVFGPPFPESRLQGYDPVTGELSIRYLFTYGALSGGQAITTRVELICDPGYKNGEYCPDDGIVVSSEVDAGSFKKKTLVVAKGRSKQESQIITEAPARVWYNKLRFTHQYDLKGNKQTNVQEFPIAHKSESLFAQCSFTAGLLGAGAGFKCESIFNNDDEQGLYYNLDMSKSRIVPRAVTSSNEPRTHYSGDSVYAKIKFTAPDLTQIDEGAAVVYYGVCNEGTDKEFTLNTNGNSVIGKIPVTMSETQKRYVAGELYSSLPIVGDGDGSIARIDVPKNGSYFVKFIRRGDGRTPSPEYDKMLVDGEIFQPSFIDGTVDEDKNYIAFEIGYVSSTIEIQFNKNVENLNYEFSLIEKVGDKTITELGDVVGRAFDYRNSKVTAGVCNVYLKMLPQSRAAEISSIESFNTFSSALKSNEAGEIITNVEVNEKVEKMSFNLAGERTSDKKIYFDIVSLDNNQNVEIENNSETIKFTIEYLLLDKSGENVDVKEYKFILDVDGYSLGENSVVKGNNLDTGLSKLVLNYDILSDTLGSSGGSVYDYITGSEQTKKLNLNYLINVNDETIQGSIPFYLRN